MPLVQVLGGSTRDDNTVSLRLYPDDNGNERVIEVGGPPMWVSHREIVAIAGNYEVKVLQDDPPSAPPSAVPAPAPSPLASALSPVAPPEPSPPASTSEPEE